jgi:hypothetical protein
LLFYFIICVICGENLPSWQEPDPAHAVDMSARAWLEQSDSEDEESERRRSAQAGEQALLLYQQAFRFAAGNAPAQTALYREPIAAEQAKQDEWEIEKKERMQRNDRWHQHQISRNSI